MTKTTLLNVTMMEETAVDAMLGGNIALNVNARSPTSPVWTAPRKEGASDTTEGVGATNLGYNAGAQPHARSAKCLLS